MYGLADYFLIDSLKRVAKRNFLQALDSWANWSPRYDIKEVIEEMYSTRGNYSELKTIGKENYSALRRRTVQRIYSRHDLSFEVKYS